MPSPEQLKSQKQEKRLAKTMNGSVNAMSGAGWVRKADVRTDEYMVEAKTKMSPDAKTTTIRHSDLRDLARRAYKEGRLPLYVMEWGVHSYVLMPEDDFLDMIGVYEEDTE